MKAKEFPYYNFLLPFFFVFHTANSHFLFLDMPAQVLLAASYAIVAAVILICSRILLKNIKKAGLFTFTLLAINFFFTEIHQLLKSHSPIPFLYRYIFIIPLLLLLILLVFIQIKRSKSSFNRLTFYLNILFLLFVLAEVFISIFHAANNGNKKIKPLHEVSYSVCDTCQKPDIYFLVFDEYSSSLSLREDYNYDNSLLDTFLLNKGFRILTGSTSNYNITNFSMASITNMSYLQIQDTDAVTSTDYANAGKFAGEGSLFGFLRKSGYDIENYSLFDIDGQKATSYFSFSNTPKEIITNKTFINTIFREIGWNFFDKEKMHAALQKKYSASFNNIHQVIDEVKKTTTAKSEKPKFVYGHFLLPHSPYFINKTVLRPAAELAQTKSASIPAYLNYVYYTNTVIQDLVTTIQQNSNRQAVIIIMGDHGFRPPVQTAFPQQYFKNQNAIYFPDKNYALLYDSISGVNQFRVILNSLFRQKITLIEDKQIYLKDRQ